MTMQLWCGSNLGRLTFSLRRFVSFYAPLQDSLDFMGIDPIAYSRATTGFRLGRDGLNHNIGANVPEFDYNGELPLGLFVQSGVSVQWSTLNALNDANTLVWFEESVPKSTPANTNPINSSGFWAGN